MPGENPDKLNDETLGCMEPVVRETWRLCAPAGIINTLQRTGDADLR